jgi:formate hydrogenlyase transcriptional activator
MILPEQEAPTKSDGQLPFEMLLADLSARFISVLGRQVDEVIVDAQRRVCDSLGLDFSTLFQWTREDADQLQLTHVHRAVDGPPIPERMDAGEFFPWSLKVIRSGSMIIWDTPECLPQEASLDLQTFRHFEVKSNLVLPLSAGGGVVFGALGFGTLRQARTWPEAMVKRLQLVAQVFAGALARKIMAEQLAEAAAQWQVTFDSIDSPVMLLDREGRVQRANAAACLAAGMTLDALLGNRCEAVLCSTECSTEQCPRARVIRSARHEEAEVYNTNSDTWRLVTGDPVLDESGRTNGVILVMRDITERKRHELELKKALEEVGQLRDQLHEENVYLRGEVKALQGGAPVIGQSRAIRRAVEQAEQVAVTDSTVLLLGETGTGKEKFAALIHERSPRRGRPMVCVNCAAIPAALIEGELFGREKGAYTGALSRQMGRFETAHRSTIFLDEIGDLPLDLQVKLLRVIEERQFERLGSSKPISVDVRIIAATNQDLAKAVAEGRFRQDLYFRLNVFPITVPPLRERREDIPLLAWSFVDEFARTMGKTIEAIPKTCMDALSHYPWPGNVRELRNVIERAMIVATGSRLQPELPNVSIAEVPQTLGMQNAERDHILRVLAMTGWRVSGSKGAAELLQMKPSTLTSRMAKLGIRRPGT